MKKQKPRLTLYDLGRIPVTPVENKSGYEDSRTLLKRLQQEERDAAAAAEHAAFLQSPQGKIQQKIQETATLAGEINAGIKASLLKGDLVPDSVILGGYTERKTQLTDKFDNQLRDELNESYEQACKELDKRKIEFKSKDAVATWVAFMMCNVYQGGIAPTPDNWIRSLERLWQLGGILDATMVTGMAPEKPADEAAPLTHEETEVERRARIADEIEKGKNEKELVDLEMRRDWQNMYRQFAEFMEKTYGVDVLQQRIVDYAVTWAEHWNKSLADPRHLNELRRALDYQQLLGPRARLLTADERTALSIEDTSLVNADFATKQDIVSRLNTLSGR